MLCGSLEIFSHFQTSSGHLCEVKVRLCIRGNEASLFWGLEMCTEPCAAAVPGKAAGCRKAEKAECNSARHTDKH